MSETRTHALACNLGLTALVAGTSLAAYSAGIHRHDLDLYWFGPTAVLFSLATWLWLLIGRDRWRKAERDALSRLRRLNRAIAERDDARREAAALGRQLADATDPGPEPAAWAVDGRSSAGVVATQVHRCTREAG